MVISRHPVTTAQNMIKINTPDGAKKPTKKATGKAVKPPEKKDGQSVTKSEKTRPERISRRWLVTIWPEHLPAHIAQQIPIDDSFLACHVDEFYLSLFIEDNVPHFRSFSASMEYGENTKHSHIQGYLELSSPVRKSALIKTLGTKHYYEQANGSQQDCLDYVLHTGTHADKPGLLYTIPTIGHLAYAHNEDNHETTLYNTALAMVLEGHSMVEVVRSCGIGISKVYFMLSNVSDRIREEGELKEGKRIEVKNQAIAQAIKSQKENIYYLRQDVV